FLRSITRSAAVRAGIGLVFGLAGTAVAWAAEPLPWPLGMQPSATPVHARLNYFHDWLLVIIFLISVFVLGLLLYVMVRFHHTRNPVPTRTSHTPVIEFLSTSAAIVILVGIAISSFKLMYFRDRVPASDMTIKITGNQWFWSYESGD